MNVMYALSALYHYHQNFDDALHLSVHSWREPFHQICSLLIDTNAPSPSIKMTHETDSFLQEICYPELRHRSDWQPKVKAILVAVANSVNF